MTPGSDHRQSYRRSVSFVLGALVAVLITTAFSSAAWAQTIHVLIVADTKVERAGAAVAKSVQIDRENLEYVFWANVPEKQLSLRSLYADKVWANDILNAIDETQVGQDDTFVFFFTGHGAYDETKKQQFFQLAADSKRNPFPGQSDLYRNDVLERIRQKNPRLTVMISDCCNVKSEALIDPSNSHLSKSGSLRTTKTISPAFESLFINCKGLVDITSSKYGEASGIDAKTWRGSCFTYPLVDLLLVNRDNEFMDWKTLIDELTPRVQKAFSVAYPNGANGQFRQTVFPYYYPGMKSSQPYVSAQPTGAPTPGRQGPRFGVRAVAQSGGGIRITEIIKNSPGEKTGLEVGDVIYEINGRSVNTEQEYSDAVDDSGKQMRVKLRNRRDGQIITPTIELGW